MQPSCHGRRKANDTPVDGKACSPWVGSEPRTLGWQTSLATLDGKRARQGANDLTAPRGGALAPLHGLTGHWNRSALEASFGDAAAGADKDRVRRVRFLHGANGPWSRPPWTGSPAAGGEGRSVGPYWPARGLWQRGCRASDGEPTHAACRTARLSKRWSTSGAANLRPNVRAEATHEACRPWAAQDNGACDCPARPKGGTPRGVASRARG
jgi:hypothetical protein